MRKSSSVAEVVWPLCAVILGCSGTDTSTGPSLGGATSIDVGGAISTGGLTSGVGGLETGGTSQVINAGGMVATGGSNRGSATGGIVSTGGTTNNNATGGLSATGGLPSTGGSRAAGGLAPTGGANATGGSPATGGSRTATGGSNAATGGKSSTSTSTGGAFATGGSSSGATGGKSSTGGTTATAGGSASFKCDNLSLAPNTTGTQPTGAVGGLRVLDWAGFKGAVSYTFDDNTASQIPNYSALKATGAHFTWFVVGSWNPSAQYKTTLADGQEIANHTYSHNATGSLSDLQQNETYLTTNFGVTAASMAAPNCDQSWSTVAPNVLFQNRGPCGGSAATVGPRDNTSPFLLPAYLPATGEAAATMTAALATGKWRIYVIHGFDSQGGTYQPVPIANVTATMSGAVSSGYWPETMTNVGAYWQGQKLISASATTTASWSLPAHFPPNMCLRITTTGGTVTQKGATVPWDSHGYYQISLDAGAVTIQ